MKGHDCCVDETIGGSGIVLRRWSDAHLVVLGEIVTSSLGHIATFMPSAASEVATPEAFLALVDSAWNDGEVFAYVIEEDDRLVGHITFAPSATGGVIGYWVRVEDVGRGIATDAVKALAAGVSNTEPGVNSLHASCDASNAASRRVLEKSGFRPVPPPRVKPRLDDRGHQEIEWARERLTALPLGASRASHRRGGLPASHGERVLNELLLVDRRGFGSTGPQPSDPFVQPLSLGVRFVHREQHHRCAHLRGTSRSMAHQF